MLDVLKEKAPSEINISEKGIENPYEIHFTRDKRLINKYTELRKKLYASDPRLVGFREFSDASIENFEDPDNQMLILHDGNNVYGGAALRISTPKKPVILNLEQDILPPAGKFYFSLKEQLPELELDKFAYAEFDHLSLHPSLRKGVYVRIIFQEILQRCIDYKVRYMFAMSDSARTRLYRQIYVALNMDTGGIHEGIDIPMRKEYEGKKMYLIYGDTKNFHTVPSDKDALCLLHPIENYEFEKTSQLENC